MLGDPARGIAGAEVRDARVGEGSADQRAAVSGEREHVRDHAAVGEDHGRVADGVDEGLVEPVLVDDRADVVEERRADPGQPGLDLGDRLILLGVDVVRAVVDRGVPHLELADEPGEQRAQGRILVDAFHRDAHGSADLIWVQAAGPGQHLADEPDVVFDHAGEQVHSGHPCCCGDPQAPWRVEVDVTGGFDADAGRLPAPRGRRQAVGPPERPREGLVAVVSGLHRHPDHAVVGGDQLIGGAFEQDPPPDRGGRLARGGRHQAVEVEPGQVRPCRERLRERRMVVQRVREDVEEAGERIRGCRHANDRATGRRPALDRPCASGPRVMAGKSVAPAQSCLGVSAEVCRRCLAAPAE